MINWTTERRKLSELTPAEYNPRQASEKDVKDLTTSLERFNLADPLIINKNNQVIGGHFRLKILREKGISEVDVRVPNRQLTDAEEKELNLRLNKNLGQWDLDALANFDEELLKGVGFDSKELDRIFQLDTKPEDDDIPEKPPTIAKRGDLWQLGRHKLLCGDSTDREQVLRLMDGKKADMVFTSPPYNVGIKYESHNDEMADGDYWKLIDGVSKNCYEVMNNGRLISWNVGVSPKSKPFDHAKMLEAIGFKFYRNIVWKKTGCQIPLYHNAKKDSRSRHYTPNYNHELIFLCSKGEIEYGEHTTMPDELEMDVWDITQFSAGGKGHPAAFPVELVSLATQVMTHKDECVYDPFLGSGSTLIACEKTNRICYGMEIDERYTDVCIERWCNYTGNKKVIRNGEEIQWRQ